LAYFDSLIGNDININIWRLTQPSDDRITWCQVPISCVR